MESKIRVMATIDEIKEAFNLKNNLFSIRYYSILVDLPRCTSYEEWEKIKCQKYPFEVIVRYGEYPTSLGEKKMYSSWDAVVKSLKSKKLQMEE